MPNRYLFNENDLIKLETLILKKHSLEDKQKEIEKYVSTKKSNLENVITATNSYIDIFLKEHKLFKDYASTNNCCYDCIHSRQKKLEDSIIPYALCCKLKDEEFVNEDSRCDKFE